jgi:crotonobetainyl-CoA:carnitine CoA-transferase CaiB-like acyl-CoA transferase
VLDLTRVIAGPLCTRFLAAYGADVLRIDPPAFDEVPALLPETTRGKRCAFLDLRSRGDREVFDRLVSRADVLVHGHRFGALERLDYSAERLSSLNPHLLTTRVDAYGYTGPWSSRRGFDSLVQMSAGIAAIGANGRPSPLPAQALDHATGYLLAAATCRALVDGRSEVRLSLARVARLLVDLGTDGDPRRSTADDSGEFLQRIDSAWGKLAVVRIPGSIEGFAPPELLAPGPLGRDAPRFAGVD